ncbi:MAG: F0F1 ATP synthase subunit alpha [Erysipelotrichaceae bacterium]|nr:F0F1 ATP synthase subunit alpha [Erysipelotrichaceae bacterium]
MSVDIKAYARNLMELANQEGQVDLIYPEIKRINDELNKNDVLLKYIDSPDHRSSEKKQALQEAFNQDLDESILYGLFLIVDTIPEAGYESRLIHEFLVYYYQTRGITLGTAYSVRELDKGTLYTLEAAFTHKLERAIKLENKLDKDLIGGVKVAINDSVWDGSYKAQINELKENLLQKELDVRSDDIGTELKNEIASFNKRDLQRQTAYTTGEVISVADGVVNLSGISKAMAGEILDVGSTKAMVMDLQENKIAAVLLGNDSDIVKGTKVASTGKVAEVPVGDELLGRVIDALGRPIDGKGPIKTENYRPIENNAPGVIERQPIDEPLQTGIKIIDSMIPIGKGQRELIIGDRQTGKTALAIDTIINQNGRDVCCIYVAIGQKNSTVAQIIEKLHQYGAMNYTTVMVAGASDLASLQYIAPYAGTSIAEYWMHQGKDVLIVYDDLSKHAVAYRTLSLLLRRPPGREAYPGDVFYLHSRLLERSCRMHDDLGGGSITALPIIETQAGDISAYIPTNVISITDGQIFLQSELFNSGIRPAIDYGLSVSRVGSAAQTKAMKSVSSSLKLDLSQYQEVLDFAQFGSDLDSTTRKQIDHGRHVVELLKQPQYAPLSTADQVILLFANKNGLLDEVPLKDIKDYEKELLTEMNHVHPQIMRQIEEEKKISDELHDQLLEIITVFTTRFNLLER